MTNSGWVWMNGELIPQHKATIPVSSTALHFGPVVFEGIRCYEFADGRTNLFRLPDHTDRLVQSAANLNLNLEYSSKQFRQACTETLIANDHTSAYIRILAFPSVRSLGFGRSGGTAEACVLTFPWQNDHLVKAQTHGISLYVSSVIRTEAHPVISKSKISANYAAGLLAIREAREEGFDDAILLDRKGAVAEVSTANIFAVFGNKLVTPPASLPILPGITRDSILVLAKEHGMDAIEDNFDSEELLKADEVFIVGTTAELTSVRKINGQSIGEELPGPFTRRMLAILQKTIQSEDDGRGWFYPIEKVGRATINT